MGAVGLKILKNKLSEYVRRAASLADAALAEAVRRGWVTPPLLGPEAAIPRQPVLSWAALAAEIAQDRADR